MFEAALWILKTGAQWHMLPQCYSNHETVHRRLRAWYRTGVLEAVLADVASQAAGHGRRAARGGLYRRHVRPRQGRGRGGPQQQGGKGVWIAAVADSGGVPLAIRTASASHGASVARCR